MSPRGREIFLRVGRIENDQYRWFAFREKWSLFSEFVIPRYQYDSNMICSSLFLRDYTVTNYNSGLEPLLYRLSELWWKVKHSPNNRKISIVIWTLRPNLHSYCTFIPQVICTVKLHRLQCKVYNNILYNVLYFQCSNTKGTCRKISSKIRILVKIGKFYIVHF